MTSLGPHPITFFFPPKVQKVLKSLLENCQAFIKRTELSFLCYFYLLCQKRHHVALAVVYFKLLSLLSFSGRSPGFLQPVDVQHAADCTPLCILGHWITLGNDSHAQQDCTSQFPKYQEAHEFEKELLGQVYGEKPVIKSSFQSQCLLQQESAVVTGFGTVARFPWNSLSWSQDLKVWRTGVGRVVVSSCGLCKPAMKAKSLHPLCVRFIPQGFLKRKQKGGKFILIALYPFSIEGNSTQL